MNVIRYTLHFAILTVAAVVFWLVTDFALPGGNSDPNFYFHYALMGVLHAISIVVSLRDNKPARPIIALSFIVLATVWSAATPILGFWGSFVWMPFDAILRRYHLASLLTLFLTGSAIGSSGYWLLVRVFWLKSLRSTDWLRTVALCVAATLLSLVALDVLKASDHIGPPIGTTAWWFAFSISLYWSEMSVQARKPAEAMETLP